MQTVEIDSVCSTMIKSGAGSVKRYGVRLFVRLSVPAWAHSSKPAAAGLPVWDRRTKDIDRLLQQRRANTGSATLSAYVGSWTKSCLITAYGQNHGISRWTYHEFAQAYCESREFPFLPARRNASAGTSYGPVSAYVCLSRVGVPLKWMAGSSWFLARTLIPTYPKLCYKKIQVSTKIKVLPSGTLPKTPDFENFASAYRSSKRVIDLARESWTLWAW